MPGKRLVSISVVATLFAVASGICAAPALAQGPGASASQTAGPVVCNFAPSQESAIAAKIDTGVPLATACAETGSTLAPSGSRAAINPDNVGPCAGSFSGSYNNGDFYIQSGRLNWDFYFNVGTQLDLAGDVTVTMPNAWINGSAINPPYQAHIEPSWYDFHASMRTYQWIGRSGGGTITPGQTLTMNWLWTGVNIDGDTVIGGAGVQCKIPSGV